MNTLTIAGFMSGTSMDALDCCIAKISINSFYKLDYKIIAQKSFVFNQKTIIKIKDYIGETKKNKINEIDLYLGEEFFNLSKDFISNYKIDAIAIHGQTIHHKDKINSIQVGSPVYMASFFNKPIIFNFRQKDIECGGTGAPLMPFLDWLIFKDINLDTLTLNIGGVSNIAFIPKSSTKDDVIGFDVGPGMSLIDECVNYFWSKKCDYNGKYSIEGKVNDNILNYLLLNTPFILKHPPKSTGREDFGINYLSNIIKKYNDIKPLDILRTLVKFSAIIIKMNIEKFVLNRFQVDQLIITGGGAEHPILIKNIKKNLDIPIINMIDYGVESKFKESLLISVLGYSKIKNIKSNIPSVTGAKKEIVLGDIYES